MNYKKKFIVFIYKIFLLSTSLSCSVWTEKPSISIPQSFEKEWIEKVKNKIVMDGSITIITFDNFGNMHYLPTGRYFKLQNTISETRAIYTTMSYEPNVPDIGIKIRENDEVLLIPINILLKAEEKDELYTHPAIGMNADGILIDVMRDRKNETGTVRDTKKWISHVGGKSLETFDSECLGNFNELGIYRTHDGEKYNFQSYEGYMAIYTALDSGAKLKQFGIVLDLNSSVIILDDVSKIMVAVRSGEDIKEEPTHRLTSTLLSIKNEDIFLKKVRHKKIISGNMIVGQFMKDGQYIAPSSTPISQRDIYRIEYSPSTDISIYKAVNTNSKFDTIVIKLRRDGAVMITTEDGLNHWNPPDPEFRGVFPSGILQ